MVNIGVAVGPIAKLIPDNFVKDNETVTKLSIMVTTDFNKWNGETRQYAKDGERDVEIMLVGGLADEWVEKLEEEMKVAIIYSVTTNVRGKYRFTELKPIPGGIVIIW